MSTSIIFAAIFLSLISIGIESLRRFNQQRNFIRFNRLKGSELDKGTTHETDAAALLEKVRRDAVAAEVALTNIASEKSTACCANDDICFTEPPATEKGLDIRCLLTQNGLDVDWVNPEDEVIQLKKDEQNLVPIDIEEVDEDEDEDEKE
jgi:hypothetical protein|eukprot:CAMPEP_0119041588 /NCGR_PEP_ID=MMETSP1177-20130426/12579_1 /TAXON_ID=2985 /ORGANISM="Ochromonas sp, Strain CCMP1899" /LENGTH=149 /DNA_ID=CAMNT_0007007759 /DNA_START=58 /DNA_END=507 /DNA_ORIENTATION=+